MGIEEVNMKKSFRALLVSALAGGMILGGSAAVNAEPVGSVDTTVPVEMALRGPDRVERAPQRAVKAPVKQAQPRQQVVTPPAPPVKPFVYEKNEFRSLTDAPYDVNGREFFCYQNGPLLYRFDDDRITLWTPTGRLPVNRLGAMGADTEFINVEYGQRLGVWANGRIADDSPQTIVSDMVARIKSITSGNWTEPTETHIAGVPVTMATGYDAFGNYWYEVIALERFGNKYAFATRTKYENRYNRYRNTELAYMISHIHPTTWSE